MEIEKWESRENNPGWYQIRQNKNNEIDYQTSDHFLVEIVDPFKGRNLVSSNKNVS